MNLFIAIKDFEVDFNGKKRQIKKGETIGLPGSALLLAAEFVIPVREKKIETAVRTPQERAITR